MALTQKAPFQGSNYMTVHAISTNTLGAVCFTFDRTVDTTIEGHPAKNNLKIVISNKINSEDYNTFLKTFLSNKEVAVKPVTYEDGTIEYIVSGVDETKTFGVVWYDGKVGSKRKIVMGKAILSGNTGNAKTVYGDIGDMPVEIQFIANAATLTATPGAFCSTYYATPATMTVETDAYGTIQFITA